MEKGLSVKPHVTYKGHNCQLLLNETARSEYLEDCLPVRDRREEGLGPIFITRLVSISLPRVLIGAFCSQCQTNWATSAGRAVSGSTSKMASTFNLHRRPAFGVSQLIGEANSIKSPLLSGVKIFPICSWRRLRLNIFQFRYDVGSRSGPIYRGRCPSTQTGWWIAKQINELNPLSFEFYFVDL